MKRNIGDTVRINPYSEVTGEIISRKDQAVEPFPNFDYKVKLFIPHITKETRFFANYNSEDGYWWQYFNDDELDELELNYKLMTR